MTKRALMIMATISLTACQAGPAVRPLTPEQSATLAPRDVRIAGLYGQACKSCHTVKDTGAPLTGDRTLWDARWEKGEAELLKSAVAGRGGMPAGGQCFSCTAKDYEALIRFMAGREG